MRMMKITREFRKLQFSHKNQEKILLLLWFAWTRELSVFFVFTFKLWGFQDDEDDEDFDEDEEFDDDFEDEDEEDIEDPEHDEL